jgi:Ca-activated chloride channel family protein
MKTAPARIGTIAIALACAASMPCAEDTRVQITPRIASSRSKTAPAAAIRVDVKLTLIPVTVTGPLGAPFPGLPKEAFRLIEDGVEQQLKYFSSEDTPVSLGVVFDASGSMEGKLDQSRRAVSQFLRTAVQGDEFFAIEFSSAPRILCDFTSDTGQIEKSLAGIKPKNWTALFDAVYLATHQMRRAKNPRRALLILSDGNDNYSRYTESELKSRVREADVTIYSIGLVGSGLLKRHLRVLRQLSDQTGGRFYEVEKMSDLPAAAEKISAAIRNQYVLGYFSTKPQSDGLYRKIEVKLNPEAGLPRLSASWRTGYYAADGW